MNNFWILILSIISILIILIIFCGINYLFIVSIVKKSENKIEDKSENKLSQTNKINTENKTNKTNKKSAEVLIWQNPEKQEDDNIYHEIKG